MAPNGTPTTETDLADLVADFVRRAIAANLSARADLTRRRIVVGQPAIAGEAGAPVIGLTQVVQLARSRATRELMWLAEIDEGFRGTAGSAYEPIAPGHDVAAAVQRVCTILATV